MKSTCCKATFHVANDGGTTYWHECDDCGHPCDVMDEASAIDQLQEYWRQNSMLKVPEQ